MALGEVDREKRQNKIYFVRESILVKWFLFVMIFLTLFATFSLFFYKIRMIIPFLGMEQCMTTPQDTYNQTDFDDHTRRTVMFFLFSEAAYNIVFFFAIFMLRNVRSDFTITQELQRVAVIRFIFTELYLGCIIMF